MDKVEIEPVEVLSKPEAAIKSVEVSLPEGALGKKVTLRSCDGVDFKVDEVVARESKTVKMWLEESSNSGPVPLDNVHSKTLRFVIKFCEKHALARAAAAAAAFADPAAAGAAASADPVAAAAGACADPTATTAAASADPVTDAAAAQAEPAADATEAPPKPPAKIKTVSGGELKVFDEEFIKVHESHLVPLIEAAKYLDIKRLHDLTLDYAADKIKGKTPEQIRSLFNIKNDFTPDEEAKAMRENRWVFEQQRG